MIALTLRNARPVNTAAEATTCIHLLRLSYDDERSLRLCKLLLALFQVLDEELKLLSLVRLQQRTHISKRSPAVSLSVLRRSISIRYFSLYEGSCDQHSAIRYRDVIAYR